jgi:putative SOS response-associated peptidase YedK
MCTRFAIFSNFKAIKEHADQLKNSIDLKPNYNAAPTHKIPIMINGNEENLLSEAHFGFYPSWIKDTKKAKFIINARAETLAEKPSFRNSFKRKRCLVPANGFFEWEKPTKQPYYFFPKESDLFFLAGIWEKYSDAHGNEFKSVAIITTKPNDMVAKVHNRMPVILDEDAQKKWLFFNTLPEELCKIMTSYEVDKMDIRKVSKEVNSPKNNYEDLLDGK